MSQETLEEIAKRIENHRLLEESKKIINKAIARYKTKYSGEDKQIWLTNAENNGGYRIVENITGSAAGIAAGAATTLTEDGYTVYKNSRLGELLIGNYAGTYNYRAPKKDIEVEIFNSAAYMPDANDLARDIMVRIADEVQSYSYSNLSEILNRVELIDNELKDLVIERENERDAMASQALLEKINAKENERMAAFQQMQSFVRQTAQLRYQPILDPIQEKIKRSFPYQKDLIIDGGPGTGKTTALIQRIKFLTSYSIEEYLDPGVNLAKITDKKKSWIFFCPNELLSLYLRNSMVEEGLEATDERVKVWSDYKKKLLRGYRLVNSDTKKPFLIYNHSEDTLLFRNQRTAIDGISGNNAKVEVMTLETSYRQSPTLLDLASAIYFSSTGKHPSYKSFLTRDPKEPKPIAFENDDETEKIQWIGSRILEIYTAYGQSIPSIAIFVPSEDQLELVARQLGSLDSLADIGISVVPCRDGKVLGDRSTVRVFCVKVIKGLEFEAVFFHNMHECLEKYSEEMVARLMYVGISRATFYLGITSTNPLKDYFQWHEHFMLGQNGYSWSLE